MGFGMAGPKRGPGAGRKPKPIARRVLTGNPGRRTINKAAPSYRKLVAVAVPPWLGDEAAQMWDCLVPQLCSQGVLESTDLHNVEIFCLAYARMREAERHIQAHGLTVLSAQGGITKNPACTIFNEATRQLATFGALLGLDPSSRSRIMGGRKGGQENPFTQLLG